MTDALFIYFVSKHSRDQLKWLVMLVDDIFFWCMTMTRNKPYHTSVWVCVLARDKILFEWYESSMHTKHTTGDWFRLCFSLLSFLEVFLFFSSFNQQWYDWLTDGCMYFNDNFVFVSLAWLKFFIDKISLLVRLRVSIFFVFASLKSKVK